MKVIRLTPEEWETMRFPLLRFLLRHSDKRITREGWRLLVTETSASLTDPGTAVTAIFTSGGQPAGIAYAREYGEEACLVAVHPALRSRGYGRRLLLALAAPWRRLSCKVAADNLSSLAMCQAAGFTTAERFIGPTGKPSLRLVWVPEDCKLLEATGDGGDPLGTAARARHLDALSQ